jgi:two-component system, NarL family, response regulator DevR
MNVGKRIEVLIADSDEFVRAGLHALLSTEADVRVVAAMASNTEAIRQSARLGPDVVLLDGSLPDNGIVEACRALRSQAPGTRVLILIDRVDATSVLAAVLAGADGCVAKRARLDDLRRVLRAVAAGEAALDAHVTRILIDHLRRQPESAGDDETALSAPERRVLQLVAAGKTNREIASALAISEKTVKNWLGHAFGKLRVTRRAHAAVRFTVPGVAPDHGPPPPFAAAQPRPARKLA